MNIKQLILIKYLIRNAIGGVKLLVYKDNFKKALEIRSYQKDRNGNNFSGPNCNSNRALIVPIQRKIFSTCYIPFFKKTRNLRNQYQTIF